MVAKVQASPPARSFTMLYIIASVSVLAIDCAG